MLTEREIEALKRACPSMSPADAAASLLRAALRQRYHRERKAGRLLNLSPLRDAIE